MPRGAKAVKTCTLDMAKKDGSIPHVSLFKLKHMRGWWPFTVNTDLEEIELAVSISHHVVFGRRKVDELASLRSTTEEDDDGTEKSETVNHVLTS